MKTLRIQSLVLVLAVASLSMQGCGTTEVAKAQQVTHAATVDFNAFIQFEDQNSAQLWKLNPQIKHTADKLRKRSCSTCDMFAKKSLDSADAVIDAYKNNRTPEMKANMDTAIAVIQELIDQIALYFLDANVRAIDPVTASKYRKTKVIP